MAPEDYFQSRFSQPQGFDWERFNRFVQEETEPRVASTFTRDIDHVLTEIQELQETDGFSKSEQSYRNNVRQMSDIKRGDHVSYEKGGEHHGIIVEKQETRITVMRWIGDVIDKEEVIMQNGNWLIGTTKINLQVVVYNGSTFSPLSVVHRAYARFGEKDDSLGLRNWASGFPQWCKTGYVKWLYKNKPQLKKREYRISHCQELSKGDHIKHQRLGYSHHEIVLHVTGNHITVIHFTSDSSNAATSSGGNKGEIKKMTHALNDNTYKVVYREGAVSDAQLVVSRAEAILTAQQGYNLLTSNCEHLATWCKTGVWQSDQVSRITLEKFQPPEGGLARLKNSVHGM